MLANIPVSDRPKQCCHSLTIESWDFGSDEGRYLCAPWERGDIVEDARLFNHVVRALSSTTFMCPHMQHLQCTIKVPIHSL